MRGEFFKRRFEIEAVCVGAEFQRALENRRAGTRAKAAVKKRAIAKRGLVSDEEFRQIVDEFAEALKR